MSNAFETFRDGAFRVLSNAFVFAFTITAIFPIVWMAYTSLKELRQFNQSIIALPNPWTFDNFRMVLDQANFLSFFGNSFYVAVISLAGTLVMGFLIGYFLSRYSFRGRSIIYWYFILGIVIPPYAWLVPVYIQFLQAGLVNKLEALALPYIAFGLPLAVFLIEGYMRNIPFELEESAMMEGCGTFTTIARIIAPLCKPVLVTVGILTFNGSWNEFPYALILIRSESLRTIPVALSTFGGQYTTNYPRLVSAMLVAIVPVLVLYVLFSRHIIHGMTAGSVKG